jgi:chromosome segregation ATPase
MKKTQSSSFDNQNTPEAKIEKDEVLYNSFKSFASSVNKMILTLKGKLKKMSDDSLLSCLTNAHQQLIQNKTIILTILSHLENKASEDIANMSELFAGLKILKDALNTYKDDPKISPVIPKKLTQMIDYTKQWVEQEKKCTTFKMPENDTMNSNEQILEMLKNAQKELAKVINMRQEHNEFSKDYTESVKKVMSLKDELKKTNKALSEEKEKNEQLNAEKTQFINQYHDMSFKLQQLQKKCDELEEKQLSKSSALKNEHALFSAKGSYFPVDGGMLERKELYPNKNK